MPEPPPVLTWAPPPLIDTLAEYRVDALAASKSATALLEKHKVDWGEPNLITRTTNGWYEFRYGVTNQGGGNVILVNPDNGKAQFALPNQKRIGVVKAMELAAKYLHDQELSWPDPISVTLDGSEPDWYFVNYGTNWFGVEKSIKVHSLKGTCRFSWIQEEFPESQSETHPVNLGAALRVAKMLLNHYDLPWKDPQHITLATNDVFVLGYGMDQYGNENTVLAQITKNTNYSFGIISATISASFEQRAQQDDISMTDALEAASQLLKVSKRNWGQPKTATRREDGGFEINYGKENVILVDPPKGKAYFRPEPLPCMPIK